MCEHEGRKQSVAIAEISFVGGFSGKVVRHTYCLDCHEEISAVDAPAQSALDWAYQSHLLACDAIEDARTPEQHEEAIINAGMAWQYVMELEEQAGLRDKPVCKHENTATYTAGSMGLRGGFVSDTLHDVEVCLLCGKDLE